MRPINKPLRNAERVRYWVCPLIRATGCQEVAKRNMLEIRWPKTADYLVRCAFSPRNALTPARMKLLQQPVKMPAAHIGWILLVLALAPLNSMALSSDRDKPMYIEADRAELNDRTGVSTYWGGVQVSQGTMVLNADTLTVHNRKRQIITVVAEGKPAQFRQRPDNQTEDVKANADHIEYRGLDEQLILLGGAKVWQAGNVFQSDRIVYDMKHNVVNAGGEHSEITDQQRVRITIQPDSNPANNHSKPDTQ